MALGSSREMDCRQATSRDPRADQKEPRPGASRLYFKEVALSKKAGATKILCLLAGESELNRLLANPLDSYNFRTQENILIIRKCDFFIVR